MVGKTNIPKKFTGDNLTANELNTIVDAYNLSVDDINHSLNLFDLIDDKCFDFESSNVSFNTSMLTYGNTRTEGLYSLYDTLVAAYPDYISKSLLGYDSSELPIYRYDFIPPSNLGENAAFPKILYTSIHSGETMGLTSGIRLFTEICDYWQTNELLRYLRWNVHFVVIPVIAPYCLNNVSRKTATGVDLNRNFPNGWVASNVEDTTYGGTSALSEPESQLMYDLFQNENFTFMLDHHNSGLYYENSVANRAMYTYYLNNNSYLITMMEHIGRYFTINFKKLSFIEKNNVSHFGNYNAEIYGGYMVSCFNNPGILLETMPSWGEGAPVDATKILLQKIYAENLAVIFYVASKYF